MASVTTERNGRKTIQFKGPDGRRRSVRLGMMDDRTVADVKEHVEHLVGCLFFPKPVCKATDEWLAALLASPGAVWLYDRLAAAGLVAHRPAAAEIRKDQPVKLAGFLDSYITGRSDVKPNTIQNYRQARSWLTEYFGDNRHLETITPGDADEFRAWLFGKVGENTARRHCGRAKQFFRAAHRKRLIRENPFADMRGCEVQPNRKRDYFVTREDTQMVLDACPDSQWRLLFALSRFGGLRCPSEHLSLEWGDVNWELQRITVRSPKTEHHAGKDTRVIPLFPELRPYLEAVFNDAEDALGRPPTAAEYVITRYRDRNANLRTQLLRIMARAGVAPWPKLFANMRATRETELAEQFPAHVVCAWMGHSRDVSTRHYLQLTDEHFRAALEGGAKSGASTGLNEDTTGHISLAKKQENRRKTLVSCGLTPSSEHPRPDSNGRPIA